MQENRLKLIYPEAHGKSPKIADHTELSSSNSTQTHTLPDEKVHFASDPLTVAKNDPWTPLNSSSHTSLKLDRPRSSSRTRSRSTSRERSTASPFDSDYNKCAIDLKLHVNAEHKETLRKLKSRLPQNVYRAMQQVDLCHFYDIEPYKLRLVQYLDL